MDEELIYEAVLARMNITWEPDEATSRDIHDAIQEARDYLTDRSGNPDLVFDGFKRTLLITCAWYIHEKRLAEFGADYAEELNTLRLKEGFGCGTEKSTI